MYRFMFLLSLYTGAEIAGIVTATIMALAAIATIAAVLAIFRRRK